MIGHHISIRDPGKRIMNINRIWHAGWVTQEKLLPSANTPFYNFVENLVFSEYSPRRVLEMAGL